MLERRVKARSEALGGHELLGALGLAGSVVLIAADQAGAEVTQLDLTLTSPEDVHGLDVLVGYAQGVHVLHCTHQL